MDKRTQNSLTLPFKILLIVASSILWASPVIAAETDPLEPVNRVVFNVNDTLDKFIVRPTSVVYKAVMPEFAERGVRNFFSNLGEVRNVVHNTLQGKMDGTARSTGRFIINTTVGIGGLFDVASKIGIEQSREDLGQTLGAWGINSGPYLVLPIVGPSSLRDGLSVVADPFLSPMTYMPLETPERIGVGAVSGLQTRADLLSAEGLLNGDTYVLYREAYLQKREFDVNDGRILSDDFLDADPLETWDDEEFLDEEF
jgi:phospholipid-binding lipoprotein MlaA